MKTESTDIREQLFAGLDSLKGSLCAALDDGTKTAKTFVAWLESLKTQIVENSQAKPGDESLMTLQEVADYLHYSKRAIQDWIANDGFPARRCGADPRFDRAEVDEWTKRHRKNARNAMAANGKVPPLQRDCKRSGSKNNVSL